MTSTIEISKGKRFILKQLREWGRNKFNFNKEYQRSKVWDKRRQQLLIDSIIKNLSIGTLILKENGNKFEVLDGQQRLQCIFDFIEGKLKTSKEITPGFPEKGYVDLEKDTLRSAAFDNFEVYYDLVRGGSDEEVASIFLRLQEGLPLNVAEKLNAMLGEMRNFVVEISKHPFFKKGIHIGEFRFAHRALAAQLVLLEHQTKFDHEPPIFPNLRFEPLKDMYEKYKTRDVPRKLQKTVKGNLDFLYRILKEDAKVLRNKSDVVMVYAMVSYLRKKYVVESSIIIRKLKQFVINFFVNVEQIRIQEGQIDDDPFVRYKVLRSKGLTLERMQERFNILLRELLAKIPKVQLKDEKRLFDFGQKLAIYYLKNKKKCERCMKEVKWEDASFHHKIFRSKGGKTTVKNGVLMHKECHTQFHKERGIDPAEY
jgi:5-methylcytosine-specific restriction endonuclease McrA